MLKINELTFFNGGGVETIFFSLFLLRHPSWMTSINPLGGTSFATQPLLKAIVPRKHRIQHDTCCLNTFKMAPAITPLIR